VDRLKQRAPDVSPGILASEELQAGLYHVDHHVLVHGVVKQVGAIPVCGTSVMDMDDAGFGEGLAGTEHDG
jgi:hypothetical protein